MTSATPVEPALVIPVQLRRPVTAAFLLSVASVVVLVWSEIWIAIAATIWSIATMLDTGTTGMIILGTLLVPLGIWASGRCLYLAWESERDNDLSCSDGNRQP